MGLLRFLVIAFFIYVIFRAVTRLIMPWAARYFVRKAGEKMQENIHRQQDGEKVYQDEKVTIRKAEGKNTHPKNDDDDDEYIDFEEI